MKKKTFNVNKKILENVISIVCTAQIRDVNKINFYFFEN